MASHNVNCLVVGAGIIGLSVACEIQRQHAADAVAAIDKELVCGRNWGVLPAGWLAECVRAHDYRRSGREGAGRRFWKR